MKIHELYIGYRVQFEKLEEVVFARVTDTASVFGTTAPLPEGDQWVVMTPHQTPCTRADIEKWQHVYPAPEDAVQHSIDRAREEIAANMTKIHRLQAALTPEAPRNET